MSIIRVCSVAIVVIVPLLSGCVGYPTQYGNYPMQMGNQYGRYPGQMPYGGNYGYGNYQGGYQPRYQDRDDDRGGRGWGNGGYRRHHDDD